MRIAIFGVEGQLGSDVQTALSAHEVVGITEAAADITDDEVVMRCLDDARPDWVINCAAMTDVEVFRKVRRETGAVMAVAPCGFVGTMNLIIPATLANRVSSLPYEYRGLFLFSCD